VVLNFLTWLDRSTSIARSTALRVALSFCWEFVIVYNKLKNDFMGRLEPDFGGIDCELGGSVRLLPLLLKRITTFFNNLV